MDDSAATDAYRGRRLIRGGGVVLLGTVAQKAIGFLFAVVLARQVSLGVLDGYTFALAFGLMCSVLGDLGLDQVTTRDMSAAGPDEHPEILGSALVAKMAAAAVTVALALLAVLAFPAPFRLPAAISLGIVLTGIPGTLSMALVARVENMVPTVGKTLGVALVSFGVLIAAGAGFSSSGLVGVHVATSLVAGVALMVVVRRRVAYRLRFSRERCAQLIRGAAPLALSTLFVVIFGRIDQILIGVLVGADQVGEVARYGVAVRLVDGLNWLPVAVATVALPALSHLEGLDPLRARRLVRRGYRFLAIGFLPVAAFGIAAGGATMGLFFGPRFTGAGDVLALLLAAHFFAGTWVLARQVLIARHQVAYLTVLAVAAAAVNVALNLWLIPRHGATGAAWANLASYSSPFVVALALAPIRVTFVDAIAAAFRPALAALGGLATMLALGSATPAAIFAFIVVMPILLLVTGSTSVNEVRELAVAFRRSK